MKDWRYVNIGENDWIFDKVRCVENPEDQIINMIDAQHHGVPMPEEASDTTAHDLIEQLPERYQKIIWSYYFDGKPITQIGRENGYSKQYAHQELKKAISLLKEISNV